MAQSTGLDPTDESYAVFVNSNQSTLITTQKSRVSIPFQANLADHEPNKGVQISLTSMLFTNTIYNITEINNKMNILVYYRAGRGKPASLKEIPVEIPVGFYNITQISNYLSKKDIMGRELVQKRFLYGAIESYCNIFEGFGAVPLDPNDPILTKAAATNDSNTKIVFQSPDLGHLIQFGTDLNTVPTNVAEFDHSYLLEGLYVECPSFDTRYFPLLKLLGFFNIDTAPAPVIPLSTQPGFTAKQGYGMTFEPTQAKTGGPAYDNTVYFQLSVENLPTQIILQLPTQFHGIVYTNSSVVLTCAYELNAGGEVIELPNGFFVQGTGISIPSPYIVGYQDAIAAQATFTNGSAVVNLVAPIVGVFTVGMAIGAAYNSSTRIPYVPGNAALFNYAVGTTPGPGLENDRCYYIVAINSPTQFVLNQNWNSPSVTIIGGAVPAIIGTLYVLTSLQIQTAGGLMLSMLASPQSITDIAGVIVPDDVTNMAGVDEIHVHCAQLRTKNLSSTSFEPLAPSDVIAVVPVEVEFGFKQSYQPPNPIVTLLGNTNVQQLDMQLTDAKGELLDFHGVDWSMTFMVGEVDQQNAVNLNSVGSFNTPFQDQLSAMEGTAPLEQKRKMQRQVIFHDAAKRPNVGSHRPHYY
jgi:hypothetical protein